MAAALAFGRRSMGQAAPNPSVGAIVVKDGVVLGRGCTAPGGRPHAEPIALAEAGAAAFGATLYVTLEPCSHHGRTPPCADAVIAAGIARVVVAIRDPDPRVAGRGLERLRASGIDVVEGVLAEAARHHHRGHITRVMAGRPSVTVKMAETTDGFAARLPGQERLMITGPIANGRVQMLRATHDAVLVGRGTAAEDDPLLTVRLPGLEKHRPIRIVLDPRLETPLRSRLIETARSGPVWFIAGSDACVERAEALVASGATVIRTAGGASGVHLADLLAELGQRGVTRVLCEGGPTLASRLVLAGLADRVVVFTSDAGLDGPGRQAFTTGARARITDPCAYMMIDEARFRSDRMRVYERSEG